MGICRSEEHDATSRARWYMSNRSISNVTFLAIMKAAHREVSQWPDWMKAKEWRITTVRRAANECGRCVTSTRSRCTTRAARGAWLRASKRRGWNRS